MEIDKIVAVEKTRLDQFGSSIALDNGVVAAGAPLDEDNGFNSGSAYIFDATNGVQVAKLLPNDGGLGDEFGSVLGMDSGLIAIGVPFDNDNGSDSGSAYIFDASNGAELFKLLPSDGAVDDLFGSTIAIDNDIVAVGSPSDNDNGHASGSAYIFDAQTGIQIVKLLPSDGSQLKQFGKSIAIDNGIVAIGDFSNDNGMNSGSVYLFDAVTGAQLFKLISEDGASNDNFGGAIAIDNGIVAIGTPWDDDNGTDSGSVYLFDVSTGVELAKLLPSDGAANDWLGFSIAIDNGVVAVGAYKDDDNGQDSGSVYLFDASTGLELFKLLPEDGTAGDLFGWSIDMDNGVVAVGALGGVDNDSDSAYLFDASTGEQLFKLRLRDGVANDLFGQSIAIENMSIAVGANRDNYNGIDSGSVYLFDSTPAQVCIADFTGDGVYDFHDISVFLSLFAGGDLGADLTGDGILNFFDISAFLQAFAQGCP
ncbi:hypothetical protein COB72_09410 [bacterium]|nr:MAG: hypothetical protein COB72_09410 [bacterium]